MSFPRAGVPALSNVFRFASAAAPQATRSCPRCFRPFSSSSAYRQSSRRQLQTATAHRTSSLESHLPPPRNAGIPDTSIAGGIPKVDQPTQGTQNGNKPTHPQASDAESATSLPEGEAQKSKPVDTKTSVSSTATPEPAPSKPRRSKLRPRKAAMSLTSKAVEQLKGLLDQPEPKLIRVGVKNRGCSGLAYHLEYVDKPGAFDEAVEQDGVKVLIDSKALFSIIGSEMDWIEDKLNERFIFKNPNITEQCGCGESFSIS